MNVYLPGHRPYYASKELDWIFSVHDPSAPQPGDLVINTQGALTRVVAVSTRDENGWTQRVGPYCDVGWYTEAGWTTQWVRYPTPAELAAYQLSQGPG